MKTAFSFIDKYYIQLLFKSLVFALQTKNEPLTQPHEPFKVE